MSEPRTQQEPTMEEILASIRRIISEDGDDGEKASEVAVAPEPAKPDFSLSALAEPSFSKPSSRTALMEEPVDLLDDEDLEYEEELDDVLVLTNVVSDDEALGNVTAATPIVPSRAPDPASEIKAMKSALDSLSDGDAQIRQFPGGGLLSPDSAALANAAFLRVGSLITTSPDGSVTLEALVKELLRPMLKTWLDEKLPAIVERLVAEEIARVSGRGTF